MQPTLVREPCPTCGSTEASLLREVPDPLGGPVPFGLVRCGGCGLVLTQPRPDEASLGLYYQDVYSGQGGAQMEEAQTNQGLWYVHEARWKVVAPWVQLGADDRVLDLGCGYGAFLAFVHGRTGAKIFGLDADPGSIEQNLCRHHGTLAVGSLEDAGFPDHHFAFVSLIHSLEHMRDPVDTLRSIRRVLAPGGILLLEVPNYGSALRWLFGLGWFPLLVPQHLSHFEVPSLRRCLEAAGFSTIHVLRPAWCPAEFTLSFGPVLGRFLGLRTPADAARSSLAARVVTATLAVAFVVVDLPLSALLRLLGRSGSLVAVARAPAQPDP